MSKPTADLYRTLLAEVCQWADPALLFARASTRLIPPRRVSVADYAAEYRYLLNTGGGYVGRWQHDVVPYLAGPMDALTDRGRDTVVIVGPGQSAKTSVAENWLFYSVNVNPGKLLWYMQNNDSLEPYVKDRINFGLIDAHPELIKAKLGKASTDNSLHYKRFITGMVVEFLTATANSLINKSAPWVVGDEIDAWDKSIGAPKALLDVRRQAYSGSKILLMSHPDRARGLDDADWSDGIMLYYRDSDRATWWWPCPECGAYSSPNPGAVRHMPITYRERDDKGQPLPLDDVALSARMACPCCGYAEIADDQRKAMNSAGKWVFAGQTIDEDGTVSGVPIVTDIAGFWIVGAMSPFVKGGIAGLVRSRVEAERNYDQNPTSENETTLKGVMAKQWGWPYKRRAGQGSIDASVLADRAEAIPLGMVPHGVRFITVSIDVQGTWFEVLVRGWGRQGESWVIERRKVFKTLDPDGTERQVNPAVRLEDWTALDGLFTDTWPLQGDTARGMRARCVVVDMHGAAGVTERAYKTWRRWKGAGLVRHHGFNAEKLQLYNGLLLRGGGSVEASRLVISYPDTARAANKAAAAGSVPVGRFNPNAFKDDLLAQLQRAEVGPDYVHFSAGLKNPEPPHEFFEQFLAERRTSGGRWEKVEGVARNEAIDLMAMSHVAAWYWGMGRINWDSPPAWASEWDTNPLVVPRLELLTGIAAAKTAATPLAQTLSRPSTVTDLARRLA
jgi:phage terminase large subunit GpA-like protein